MHYQRILGILALREQILGEKIIDDLGFGEGHRSLLEGASH